MGTVMSYEEDEARRAARARLEQRMQQRGTPAQAARPSSRASIELPTALPIPRQALWVIAGIALLLIVGFITRCSAPPVESDSDSSGRRSDAVVVNEVIEQLRGTGTDIRKTLVSLIGDEDADKLLNAARTNDQARWIAAHPEAYEPEGIEVQTKILKLAANEPQAVPFVREYPDRYPADNASADKSIALPSGRPSPDVPETKTPHLYQWDRRWGNTVYSSAPFGLTGCGPTSLAMVYQGLTGKTDITPYDLAQIAQSRGYMSEFNGTANTFFGDMAGELGMYCEELYPTAENLTEALSNGHVVIASLEPGIFTTSGHFFVLAGVAKNGEVILNDPYSYERSSVTWPAETIAQEAVTFYSYSRA